MSSRSLIALSGGIVLVWLTQWLVMHAAGGVASSWARANPLCYSAILEIMFSIGLVLPGFFAGWIAGRHGIRLGALTGLLGGTTYSIVSPMLHMHHSVWHFLSSGTVLTAVASSAFGLILTSAAGGAAGQLLRSNNRRSGP